MAKQRDLAQQIQEAILEDATDRRGWRQEYWNFDEEVRAELRATWQKIIRKILGGKSFKRPTIACGNCRGVGRLEINGCFADTLAALQRLAGEVTGAELARMMKVNATAMNNRLAWLEKHGFATSRRYGRQRFYKVKG